MGNQKLSLTLLDLGFFSALGTSEYSVTHEKNYVKRGTANTYDSNNGVMVIYDEEGRPWICSTGYLTDRDMDELHGHSLKRGAWVPHSNDGGEFVREILPKL